MGWKISREVPHINNISWLVKWAKIGLTKSLNHVGRYVTQTRAPMSDIDACSNIIPGYFNFVKIIHNFGPK